jgi:hypothetical protein
MDTFLKGVFSLKNHSILDEMVNHKPISQIWQDDPIPHVSTN